MLRKLLIGSGLALAMLLGTNTFAATASDTPNETVTEYLDRLPLYHDVVAAQAADRVAWVRQLAGERTVWVADRSGGTARRVGPTASDGLIVDQLDLSANGRWLVLRFGPPAGRVPRVDALGTGRRPERRILAIDLDSGVTHEVHAGDAVGEPRVSADGRLLALVDDSAIRLYHLDGNVQPAGLIELDGSPGELSWSPAEARLAFVEYRAANSFIVIYDSKSGNLRWLAPEISADAWPTWSPDGRRLAFIRAGEEYQSYRFQSRLEGIPWSVMLADAETGTTVRLWTADRGRGSALYDDGHGAPLAWHGDAEVAFTWEKTGFQQLYAVRVADGHVRTLTTLPNEVWYPVMAADGRGTYVLANPAMPERFEVWFVPVDGSPPRPAGNGEAHPHRPGVAMANGCILVPMGTGATPRVPSMACGADGRAASLDGPVPGFPVAALGTPRVVTLTAADGLNVRGMLIEPAGGGNGAALVYAHGGSREIVTASVSDFRVVWAAVAQGYRVLAVNYRSGTGYGLAFREAAGYGGGGGTDIQDVIAAGRYLVSTSRDKAGPVGIFGGSYGGYLVTAAMAQAPDLFLAGASNVGVVDWQIELELDGGRPLPFRTSLRSELEELAFRSSAAANLDGWKAPVLLIAGGNDEFGWLEQAVQLGQALRRRGVDVEAHVEPGGLHGGEVFIHDRARILRTLTFFDRHLLGASEAGQSYSPK